MGLLAGLGAYGHHSGWKLPKFSAFASNGVAARDDWCEEHAVPESQCVECNPDLLPRGKDYGWCKEHGVQNCPLEHPDVAQVKKRPETAEEDSQRAAQALASAPRPENNAVCKNYRRRIQFASLEAVKKAGVDVALVDRQPIVESISANGQITYDQTRFASLSSRLPGTVWHVEKNVGDQVRAGEVLALVDAAEVGRAKTGLIQALAQEELQRKVVSRLDTLSSQGIVPGRQWQTAQTEYVQARARLLSAQQALGNLGLSVNVEQLRGLPEEKLAERLRLLGLPGQHIQQLSPDETTANLLPVKAPMDGIIVARQVVAGEVVDSSRVLFQLADTSRMWLTLNVSVEDAGRIVLGQPVRFRPDGSRDEVSGTLVWISTTADQQTRMVTVRAELPNPKGQLRNETFGAGRIVLREEQEAIVVPNEAIHWEGCCHVVFVRDKGYFDKPDSPKAFHIRTVRLGAGHRPEGLVGGTFTEVVAGVLPGEVLAAKGSDVLRAELLKNNLGEGCCAVK
ncbi:MAG: efflux transporter periplasmic adaptor subunit [Planctomycetes bacterium RBG_16_64_12]|nr:MAG: efflux transporter periplasmic adaptor subunit [Planctomycetes bacterium RBG_16_64_12]